MKRPLLLLLFILALIPRAGAEQSGPLACNPQEAADVCELKVQRNEAFDQVAIEKRKQQLMVQAEKTLEGYWQEWVAGDLAKAGWWWQLWEWLSRKKLASR